MNTSSGMTVCVMCLLAGCVNPLPFGPGRVKVELEKVELDTVPESSPVRDALVP